MWELLRGQVRPGAGVLLLLRGCGLVPAIGQSRSLFLWQGRPPNASLSGEPSGDSLDLWQPSPA